MKTDYNNRGIDDSDVSKDRELVLSSHSLSPSACGCTIYSLDKFMEIIKTHIPGVLFIEPAYSRTPVVISSRVSLRESSIIR